MAYEPTNWQAGDVVTSAKLNKMEQGIARNDVVECIIENLNSIMTLNKTWQEIWDNNYTSIALIPKNNNSYAKNFVAIRGLQIDGGAYIVFADGPSGNILIFTCNSPDDYPATSSQEQSDSSGEDAG